MYVTVVIIKHLGVLWRYFAVLNHLSLIKLMRNSNAQAASMHLHIIGAMCQKSYHATTHPNLCGIKKYQG